MMTQALAHACRAWMPCGKLMLGMPGLTALVPRVLRLPAIAAGWTLLLLAACAMPATPIPSPPAGVQALAPVGPHETRTDLMVADLYTRYGPHFGRMESTSYSLPEDLAWADVEAHYSQAMRDWKTDDRFPPRSGKLASRTWVKGREVLVIEQFAAGGSRVLVVATNIDTRD